MIQQKSVTVLVVALFVQLIGVHINPAASAVVSTRRTEDTKFWRQNGESRLKQVLAQQNKLYGNLNNLAKNVIIFVGDGMGMSSVTAGRIYKGQLNGKTGEEETLNFDLFPNTGMAKTYNTDRQVPDSAGTATAIFSGVKTKYRWIGMDENTQNVTSILDWGQSVGKRTGFVTTTRVTHATPAALYANVKNRNWECDSTIPEELRSEVKDIARQLIEDAPGKYVNVIMGGGKECLGTNQPMPPADPNFLGSMEDVCSRTDGRNFIDEWLEIEPTKGSRSYVQTTEELSSVNGSDVDHLMGLFNHNHMSYSYVRDTSPQGEPSLSEMTTKAIEVLVRPNSPGFVLVVEGGRIDHGHHQNHARLALNEVVEMDKAVEAALKLTNPEETLIIVTADHSHAFTMNGYPLRGNDILGLGNSVDVEPYETLTYANGPGFFAHRSNVTNATKENTRDWTWRRDDQITAEERASPYYRHLSAMSMKDETHGGEDVPVYAFGPGASLIGGTFEQSYIAYVVSYSMCMGPAMHLNPACSDSPPKFVVAALPHSSGGRIADRPLFTIFVSILATVILIAY